MSISINGNNGLTFNDGSTQNTSPFAGGLGFRNRIINGACMIDQRNAGAPINSASTGYYADRWGVSSAISGKFNVGQASVSTATPIGFSKCFGITNIAGFTPGATDQYRLYQVIEGLNMADLNWGTSSAKTVTLSFWVNVSVAGTYAVSLFLGQSPYYPTYVTTYTVTSPNTWQQVSITMPGSTSGSWPIDNTGGITLSFNLGCGSNFSTNTLNTWQNTLYLTTSGLANWIGTTGATFYITGVQLEKGSTATSFDYRPYGTELQLCQRYFEKSYSQGQPLGTVTNGELAIVWGAYSFYGGHVQYKVTKRTAPTITTYNSATGGTGTWYFYPASTSKTATTTVVTDTFFEPNGAAAWTANEYTYMQWTASAEL